MMAFTTVRTSGSFSDADPVLPTLATTQWSTTRATVTRIGDWRDDRDRDPRDRDDERGGLDPRDVFMRDLDLPDSREREVADSLKD